MYKSILVPLAEPLLEQPALDAGIQLAEASDARLFIVHVQEPLSEGKRRVESKALLDAAGYAADQLDESVSFHVLEQLQHATHAHAIADTLKQFAAEDSIDLIVMNRRRHSLSRLLFGSVGERLVLTQDVPILFVPPRQNVLPSRGCRVLAPLDGTTAGEAVLHDAAKLARTLNGSLTLTRVLGVLTYVDGEVSSEISSLIEEEGVTGEAQAQEYLDRTAERLATEGVQTRWYTVPGESVSATVRKTAELERIHVIALAPRSGNGTMQFASNSVTESIMQRAETALLVRRQPHE